MIEVAIRRQFICGEEADEEDLITGIEEVRFRLRIDVVYYLGYVARHFFVVASDATSEVIGAVIIGSGIVPFYGLRNLPLLLHRGH